MWLPDREGHKFGLVVKLGSRTGNRSALTSWFGGFFFGGTRTMYNNLIEPQCAANSIGLANGLITTLVSTLLTMHCNISSNDMWPQDYGPMALLHGE